MMVVEHTQNCVTVTQFKKMKKKKKKSKVLFNLFKKKKNIYNKVSNTTHKRLNIIKIMYANYKLYCFINSE